MPDVAKQPAGEGSRAGRARQMPDLTIVVWATLAAFLIVLVAIATSLPAPRHKLAPARTIIVRRIYRTTIVEQLVPRGLATPPRATVVSSSRSVASNPVASAPAPITRAS